MKMRIISRIKRYVVLLKMSMSYQDANPWEVFFDYLKMYNTRGISFQEYKNFRMLTQPQSFRKDFLCIEERRLYLDLLNPILFHNCSRNKYITHKMFEGTGIKTSELYCFYQPECKVYVHLGMTDIADSLNGVCQILKKKDVKECVMKYIDSSHGDGVVVIKDIKYIEHDAVVTLFNGEEKRMSELLSDRSLIFESVIKQSQQLTSFNESSVNSIRFMTSLYPNGEAKIIGGFIKIGRKGKCIDNAGNGGNVDAGIDMETGRIYHVCQFDGWDNVKKIEKHPDTGVQLEGVIIDNWDAIRNEVIAFQKAFPYCKAAGWDIAITKEGPVVVEVNDAWDPTGQLFANKGWRKEIRDCYFAWKSTGKKWANRVPCQLSARQIKKLMTE